MSGVGGTAAVWRGFDAGWYQTTYPMAEELLSADPLRRPEDIYAEQVRILQHSPNQYFSESWYLSKYPSVRAAVLAGDVGSGFDHFCRGGYAELAPHWLFDPAYYRDQYKRLHGRELAQDVDGDPYDHYLRVGQYAGLSGHWLFDPAAYTALSPYDVVCRILVDGPFTTYLLHVQTGGAEPAVSNLFDPVWYLARYTAVAEVVAAGRWTCALHHYLANEDPTGFDPSSRFSERTYLASCPDVAAAVKNGGFRNGFDHFLRHGRAEGRFFAPAGTDPYGPEPCRDVAVTTGFPLRTRMFDAVTFLPCVRDLQDSDTYTFGALDRNGKIIEAFSDSWITMRSDNVVAPQEAGSFIYGGVLMSHFGHVLVDALARLWFLRERPDLPVLWHWIDLPVGHDVWPNWLDEVWRVLGLDRHRHHRITTPITVEQVILPDSGMPAPNVMHAKQAQALAVRPCARPRLGNRVWLSRRGLPKQLGRLDGEEQVEAVLAARGWTTLRPEDHPVADQVDIFATAAVVAGCIGSAFHAVLLSASPRARLILVTRPGVPLIYYNAVARARGLRQYYVVPDLKPVPVVDAWATFELVDPERLADAVCDIAEMSGTI